MLSFFRFGFRLGGFNNQLQQLMFGSGFGKPHVFLGVRCTPLPAIPNFTVIPVKTGIHFDFKLSLNTNLATRNSYFQLIQFFTHDATFLIVFRV